MNIFSARIFIYKPIISNDNFICRVSAIIIPLQMIDIMKKGLKNIITRVLRFKIWSRKNFAAFNSLRSTVIIARTSAKVADRLTGMSAVACPIIFSVINNQLCNLLLRNIEQQRILSAIAHTTEPVYTFPYINKRFSKPD